MIFAWLRKILLSLIGAILAWSGWVHLTNPYSFITAVKEYDLLPSLFVVFVAGVLPSFQLVCGSLIIFDFFRLSAVKVSAAMFAVFGIAQSSQVFQGRDIDCGYFGVYSGKVTFLTAFIVWAIAAFLIFEIFIHSCRANKSPSKN